jgi:hypothetical protein
MSMVESGQVGIFGGRRKGVGLALVLSLSAACSHVVLIKSDPPGATASIDGEVRGKTPLFFEEATGFGRTYQLHLELDGYHPQHVELQQRNWWHSCLWPSVCLVPFTLGVSGLGLLFARSLEDEYTFLMRPLPARAPAATPDAPAAAPDASPIAAPTTAPTTTTSSAPAGDGE